MTDVTRSARKASPSGTMEGLARLGLGARATIYVLMGVIAAQIAYGGSSREADQRGALSGIARQNGGMAVLALLAVGFVGYSLWRLSEAAFSVVGEGADALPRIKSLVRGIIYGGFAVTTLSLLFGAESGSQDAQQQGLTAEAMSHTGGRLLVGVVGLIVAFVGLSMVCEGATKKFEKLLRMADMSATTREVVRKLGMVGTVARGLVIALARGLVVEAAVRSHPDKARGLDGALRTLSKQPYGAVLLGVAAIGLVVFGLYGYAEARWHRT